METKLDVRFDVKALADRHFEGHGAIFGNVDEGGDMIARGAFGASLAEHKAQGTWPHMFWMHQRDQVPGVWHEIAEDGSGLYVKGELVDTQLGRDVHTLLQKKAVRGLSIGYRAVNFNYDNAGNRVLREVKLREVSIVSTAMNPLAQVSQVKARLSSEGVYVPTEREFEEFLRAHGYSHKFAKHAVAKLFGDASFLRDSEGEPRDAVGGADDLADVLFAAHALADATEQGLYAKTLETLIRN